MKQLVHFPQEAQDRVKDGNTVVNTVDTLKFDCYKRQSRVHYSFYYPISTKTLTTQISFKLRLSASS